MDRATSARSFFLRSPRVRSLTAASGSPRSWRKKGQSNIGWESNAGYAVTQLRGRNAPRNRATAQLRNRLRRPENEHRCPTSEQRHPLRVKHLNELAEAYGLRTARAC